MTHIFDYATSSCIRPLGRLFSKRQRERNWLNAARVKNRNQSWAKNKRPQEQKKRKRKRKERKKNVVPAQAASSRVGPGAGEHFRQDRHARNLIICSRFLCSFFFFLHPVHCMALSCKTIFPFDAPLSSCLACRLQWCMKRSISVKRALYLFKLHSCNAPSFVMHASPSSLLVPNYSC